MNKRIEMFLQTTAKVIYTKISNDLKENENIVTGLENNINYNSLCIINKQTEKNEDPKLCIIFKFNKLKEYKYNNEISANEIKLAVLTELMKSEQITNNYTELKLYNTIVERLYELKETNNLIL